MANHPSAEKRHRQSLKHRKINRETKAAINTSVKKVLEAVSSSNPELAKQQVRASSKLLDKAACHGVLHKNTARRRISRIQKRANSISA